MKFLVLGSGGRELAIVKKLSEDYPGCHIFCFPGNIGTSKLAENLNINRNINSYLINFSIVTKIDLVIIGPESFIDRKIVDEMLLYEINVVGPKYEMAKLESDKWYAKKLMMRLDIPTPKTKAFTDPTLAIKFLSECTFPIILKRNGLNGGKGVYILKDYKSAQSKILDIISIDTMVLIEEFVEGEEFSIIFAIYNNEYTLLPPSRDFKKRSLGSNVNTGGMGATTHCPNINKKDLNFIENKIMKKIVSYWKTENLEYNGFLYMGIIKHDNKIKILEFNCRLGDPETQVILPKINSKLFSTWIEKRVLSLSFSDLIYTTKVLVNVNYPYTTDIMVSIPEGNLSFSRMLIYSGLISDSLFKSDAGRVLSIVVSGKNFANISKKLNKKMDNLQGKNTDYRCDI